MIRQSNLNDPHLTTLLFAIMVKQCGGIVTITQADIDVVAYGKLIEEGLANGDLVFTYIEKEKAA